MGTTKGRKSRRNNSRPTAFSFLSNIALGSENEKPPDEPSIRKFSFYSPTDIHFVSNRASFGGASLHSTDSSFSAEDESALPSDTQIRTYPTPTQPIITVKGKNVSKNLPLDQNSNLSDDSTSSGETQHHKLTREDSERPIASEKIKKKSNRDGTMVNGMRPSEMKREMNEQFKLNHPELRSEITLSKIRAIKLHLLEIGKQLDLEISSVSHAYVYFEKLVVKNVVTKKNRKLIAACCLFLASKVNEAKGTWFQPLLEAMDDELDVDSKEIHEHEFAVFADLEFNLYVPKREFMPHFERIFSHLEHKSIQEYLGRSTFFNGVPSC
ncbi:hypothetical protein G6F56_008454 [Rhizopus delemar]|nr:hypothetical protein G6F56_008454 [Rhizopus delemar]